MVGITYQVVVYHTTGILLNAPSYHPTTTTPPDMEWYGGMHQTPLNMVYPRYAILGYNGIYSLTTVYQLPMQHAHTEHGYW